MLASELGHFVAGLRFDALPPAVVDTVKLRVLDTLGAGIAGWRIGNHRALLALLGSTGEASVWGDGVRKPLRDAALVNSFLAHSSYLDDGSRFTGGHPSSVVLPSSLALAEHRRLDGRQLITAVAAGYEVFLRLGRAIYPSVVERGLQSTAVIGAVSSAAAAASLLGLDGRGAGNAIAIACNLGVGLKEALKASRSQPLQVARSCEGGLLAAQFAASGAEGAATIIEEGLFKAFADRVDAAPVAAGLGSEFRIFETYVKVHGGCRGNHAPVDAALQLLAVHCIAASDVERVTVAVDSVTFRADIHEPRNGDQAQFSVPFAVAVALLEGDASLFRYTDDMVVDPQVRGLMRRIDVVAEPAFDPAYPSKRGARVEMVLRDGRRISNVLDNALGEPESPLGREAIEGKFRLLAEPVLGERAARLMTVVAELERLEDVGALATLTAATR
ncbi:MAG: MmgE/PrpD family protein [Hyphomicrobiaceae bacterium]|nr:MmgE/PrpD family protein [Hyphomicrobiaceae bacterium]